uniref:Rab-GAP TBC domain-containing protein n=1 Tax=Dracunculus medinensis TaxID=318479 RepID=A0A158Q5U4_DRAME
LKFIASPTKKAEKEYANVVNDENVEYHWQVVERILFIYSKLNPGVKYVQGMNEIIGPIYYVLASDNDDEWARYAEADAYYCFQLLMSEIKDNFIKTLDNSYCGIESLMSQFHERLQICDEALYKHITDLAIKPQFYAFRWLSLLLSQEFPLPDVITIWDSLFSATNRFNLLCNICLAMLEKERDELLSADFSTCLRLLQNYREIDVGQLISFAHELEDGLYARCSSSSIDNRNSKNQVEKVFSAQKSKLIASLSNFIKTFSKK